MKGLIGAVMVIALLGGCATTQIYLPPSYPARILDTATEIQDVAPYVAPQRVLDCEKLDSIEKRTCRDSYLDAIILGTDVRWMAYEGELFDGAQQAQQPSTLDKVLTLAGLGLGAAAVMAPIVAAPGLALAAGMLPSVQAALHPQTDPFFGRTLSTIDALMVAGRAGILEEILACEEQPINGCSIGMAISLADRYYRAGSIPGALSEAGQAAAYKTFQVHERMRTKMLKMKGVRP